MSRRNPFTEDEDALLCTLHDEFGSKWRLIAPIFNRKTHRRCSGRQLAHRFNHLLDRQYAIHPWTPHHLQKLLEEVRVVGCQFEKISRYLFGGCSASQLKNQYHQAMRKSHSLCQAQPREDSPTTPESDHDNRDDDDSSRPHSPPGGEIFQLSLPWKPTRPLVLDFAVQQQLQQQQQQDTAFREEEY